MISTIPTLITPIAHANNAFHQLAASLIKDGTPCDETMLKEILGRLVSLLVADNVLEAPSEVRIPGYIKLTDEGFTYWISPAEYEELLQELRLEIVIAEDYANYAVEPTNKELFDRCQRATGVTVDRLARKLGVSPTALRRILAGATAKNLQRTEDFERAMRPENWPELLLEDKTKTK